MGRSSSVPGAPEQYCPTCERSFAEPGLCPLDRTPLIALEQKDFVIGRVLDGRYTVIERLGEGGMGAVYRARQDQLDREVAIKVVSPRLVAEPEAIKRFLREAKLASRLSHPNAVAVLDFGQSGDLFFLVMELLSGQTLDLVLKEHGALPIDRAVAIATQICDALDGAHGIGIIHRDLKPANIMVAPGAGGRDLVKVLDFGLAKTMGANATAVTQSGAMLGTPAYMPPELALGKDCDGRADLYSLGCLLYVMLSGRLPFGTQTLHELIARHAYEDPEPLVGFPPGLTAVVMKLLAKDPADRFQTAADTLAALATAWNDDLIESARSSASHGRARTPVSLQRISLQTAAVAPPAPRTSLIAVPRPHRRAGPGLVLALASLVAIGAGAVIAWDRMRTDERAAASPANNMMKAAAEGVGNVLIQPALAASDAAPALPPPVVDLDLGPALPSGPVPGAAPPEPAADRAPAPAADPPERRGKRDRKKARRVIKKSSGKARKPRGKSPRRAE